MKTRIKQLRRQIAARKRDLEKFSSRESRAKSKWAVGYGKYMAAAAELAKLTRHGTKKEESLKAKVLDWPQMSCFLTAGRDRHRDEITTAQNELTTLGLDLTRLIEQQSGDERATNEIVAQVFDLNDAVVRAATAREDCLNRHVFPRLISEDGKLSSQVSFTSKDGKRRVVAMVNTMTLVQGDLARKAQEEISKFFSRFKTTKMDANTKAMFEITEQILVEKTKFKVGPDLYRFLGLKLDDELFPELSLAQQYLRQSIRSEKTNSYIRIFERSSPTDKWQVVRQA